MKRVRPGLRQTLPRSALGSPEPFEEEVSRNEEREGEEVERERENPFSSSFLLRVLKLLFDLSRLCAQYDQEMEKKKHQTNRRGEI